MGNEERLGRPRTPELFPDIFNFGSPGAQRPSLQPHPTSLPSSRRAAVPATSLRSSVTLPDLRMVHPTAKSNVIDKEEKTETFFEAFPRTVSATSTQYYDPRSDEDSKVTEEDLVAGSNDKDVLDTLDDLLQELGETPGNSSVGEWEAPPASTSLDVVRIGEAPMAMGDDAPDDKGPIADVPEDERLVSRGDDVPDDEMPDDEPDDEEPGSRGSAPLDEGILDDIPDDERIPDEVPHVNDRIPDDEPDDVPDDEPRSRGSAPLDERILDDIPGDERIPDEVPHGDDRIPDDVHDGVPDDEPRRRGSAPLVERIPDAIPHDERIPDEVPHDDDRLPDDVPDDETRMPSRDSDENVQHIESPDDVRVPDTIPDNEPTPDEIPVDERVPEVPDDDRMPMVNETQLRSRVDDGAPHDGSVHFGEDAGPDDERVPSETIIASMTHESSDDEGMLPSREANEESRPVDEMPSLGGSWPAAEEGTPSIPSKDDGMSEDVRETSEAWVESGHGDTSESREDYDALFEIGDDDGEVDGGVDGVQVDDDRGISSSPQHAAGTVAIDGELAEKTYPSAQPLVSAQSAPLEVSEQRSVSGSGTTDALHQAEPHMSSSSLPAMDVPAPMSFDSQAIATSISVSEEVEEMAGVEVQIDASTGCDVNDDSARHSQATRDLLNALAKVPAETNKSNEAHGQALSIVGTSDGPVGIARQGIGDAGVGSVEHPDEAPVPHGDQVCEATTPPMSAYEEALGLLADFDTSLHSTSGPMSDGLDVDELVMDAEKEFFALIGGGLSPDPSESPEDSVVPTVNVNVQSTLTAADGGNETCFESTPERKAALDSPRNPQTLPTTKVAALKRETPLRNESLVSIEAVVEKDDLETGESVQTEQSETVPQATVPGDTAVVDETAPVADPAVDEGGVEAGESEQTETLSRVLETVGPIPVANVGMYEGACLTEDSHSNLAINVPPNFESRHDAEAGSASIAPAVEDLSPTIAVGMSEEGQSPICRVDGEQGSLSKQVTASGHLRGEGHLEPSALRSGLQDDLQYTAALLSPSVYDPVARQSVFRDPEVRSDLRDPGVGTGVLLMGAQSERSGRCIETASVSSVSSTITPASTVRGLLSSGMISPNVIEELLSQAYAARSSTGFDRVNQDARPPLFPKRASPGNGSPRKLGEYLASKLAEHVEASGQNSVFDVERSIFESHVEDSQTASISPPGSPPVQDLDYEEYEDYDDQESEDNGQGMWDMISESRFFTGAQAFDESEAPSIVVLAHDETSESEHVHEWDATSHTASSVVDGPGLAPIQWQRSYLSDLSVSSAKRSRRYGPKRSSLDTAFRQLPSASSTAVDRVRSLNDIKASLTDDQVSMDEDPLVLHATDEPIIDTTPEMVGEIVAPEVSPLKDPGCDNLESALATYLQVAPIEERLLEESDIASTLPASDDKWLSRVTRIRRSINDLGRGHSLVNARPFQNERAVDALPSVESDVGVRRSRRFLMDHISFETSMLEDLQSRSDMDQNLRDTSQPLGFFLRTLQATRTTEDDQSDSLMVSGDWQRKTPSEVPEDATDLVRSMIAFASLNGMHTIETHVSAQVPDESIVELVFSTPEALVYCLSYLNKRVNAGDGVSSERPIEISSARNAFATKSTMSFRDVSASESSNRAVSILVHGANETRIRKSKQTGLCHVISQLIHTPPQACT